jgi:hypothetical protein
MPDDLTPGLHEAIVTAELRARIERARAEGWLVEWKPMDDVSIVDILARHIHDRARERIAAIPASIADRRRVQIHLANRLLYALSDDLVPNSPAAIVDADGQVLLEVAPPPKRDRSWTPTPRPGIPLRESMLLVNGHKDLQIGTQVALEIQSADRVDLLCAFVRFAGLRLI